jgi:hypothetical protein
MLAELCGALSYNLDRAREEIERSTCCEKLELIDEYLRETQKCLDAIRRFNKGE